MAPSRCAFCAHENPVDSKFCNECGAPLHLAPCAQCEAVNDALAPKCYRCGSAMAAQFDDIAMPRMMPPLSMDTTHVPEAFARRLDAAARVEPTLSPAPTRPHEAVPSPEALLPREPALPPAPTVSPEAAPSPAALFALEPTLAAEPPLSPAPTSWPEQTLRRGATLALDPALPREATLSPAATASSTSAPDLLPSSVPMPSSGVATPTESVASPRLVVESMVMPADEVRLAATRDMIAAQRRQRIARSALIAIALLCAVPILYYELFGGEPLGEWLRRWSVPLRPASRAPNDGAGASVVLPTPANADAAQPSSTSAPAPAAATPDASSDAAPGPAGAAAGSDAPSSDEPTAPETSPAGAR